MPGNVLLRNLRLDEHGGLHKREPSIRFFGVNDEMGIFRQLWCGGPVHDVQLYPSAVSSVENMAVQISQK
jgi:hypothetical protein